MIPAPFDSTPDWMSGGRNRWNGFGTTEQAALKEGWFRHWNGPGLARREMMSRVRRHALVGLIVLFIVVVAAHCLPAAAEKKVKVKGKGSGVTTNDKVLGGALTRKTVTFSALKPSEDKKGPAQFTATDAEGKSVQWALLNQRVPWVQADGSISTVDKIAADKDVDVLLTMVNGEEVVAAVVEPSLALTRVKARIGSADASREVLGLLDPATGMRVALRAEGAALSRAGGEAASFSDLAVGREVEAAWREKDGKPCLILVHLVSQ
jgi:hypothetical protein